MYFFCIKICKSDMCNFRHNKLGLLIPVTLRTIESNKIFKIEKKIKSFFNKNFTFQYLSY